MALLPLLQQSWLELHKTPFHALLFIVLLLLSFVYIFKLFRSGKPNFPPSPPKLPIIGNLHQLGALPHPGAEPGIFVWEGQVATLIYLSRQASHTHIYIHFFI